MVEGRVIDLDPERSGQKSAEGIVDISDLTGMVEILWNRRETRRKQRKQKST
jgi:hypothetical protein